MIRQELKKLIQKSLDKEADIVIETPAQSSHGDYSSNIALIMGGNDPFKFAQELKEKMGRPEFLDKIEVVKPGFINFFLSPGFLQKKIEGILKKGFEFPELNKKINVEFISANPTGPLTLGNGRGGFCGDALANALEKVGCKVTREYYINDTGEQIRKLGHSVIGDSEAVYKGDYINELKIKGEDPEEVGQKACKQILDNIIKPSVAKMGIDFDVWFSQKSLDPEEVLALLEKKGLTYEKDGALWFNSEKFGDDKDRVLIRKNKEKTYFASDIAYLKNKFERGFDKLIFFLGADHAGYVKRMEAAAEALGYNKKDLDFMVMQLVRLFEGGRQVRMSKRAGTYVTIDELIDEVGLDVARFFFLMRGSGSHLNFDLELAKEKSEKNPVYYVQYAHARISSILKKPNISFKKADLSLLKRQEELDLIKKVIRFPEVIKDTACDYQVQRLTQYVRDLADLFHKFYEKHQVLGEDKELTKARLCLISITKHTLSEALGVMGISAPEKM